MRRETSAVKAESIADHFIAISVDKWNAGSNPADLRMKRYQGYVPVNSEGRPLVHDDRWTQDDAAVRELEREIARWATPCGVSRGEGALLYMREVNHFNPRPYQEHIVRRLYIKKRLCVRSPRGAGKSAILANIILHFTTCHTPCKVPTTAGSWPQLEEFLWPEINLWARQADWGLIGMKPKVNLLNISFGGGEDGSIEKANQKAFAIRSDESSKIEGAHSENVLMAFDEAKSIEDVMFDACEGTLSHSGAYAIIVSTPGGPNGRFYDIQSRKEGYEDWEVFHITYQMQVDALEGEKKQAKIEWAAARKRQWGENSPMYKNHVLGEFADVSDEAVIPLEWVEAAVERWKIWRDAGFPEEPEWVGNAAIKTLGADIAGEGKDRTAIAHRVGYCIKQLEFAHKAKTEDTALRLMRHGATHPVVRIEVDGMGVGVYHRCCEFKRDDTEGKYANIVIESVIAGSKTHERDKSGELGFVNTRSWLWWRMRELLEPDSGYEVRLPDVPQLIGDLTTPKWELKEGTTEFKSRIAIESKKDIRKRLKGRSTDAADAVILAMASDLTAPVTEFIKVSSSVDAPGQNTFYDPEAQRQWPDWFYGRFR